MAFENRSQERLAQHEPRQIAVGLRTGRIRQPCPAQRRMEGRGSHEAFPASWILLH